MECKKKQRWNQIKQWKKYKIGKSPTPLGKISMVLWFCKPCQRMIEILPSGVGDFPILYFPRCYISVYILLIFHWYRNFYFILKDGILRQQLNLQDFIHIVNAKSIIIEIVAVDGLLSLKLIVIVLQLQTTTHYGSVALLH